MTSPRQIGWRGQSGAHYDLAEDRHKYEEGPFSPVWSEVGTSDPHDYVSTACQHTLHARCRRVCKFCDVACRCGCGHPTEGDTTAGDIASAVVWSAKACYRVEGGEPAEILAAHHQLMADVAALYKFETTGEVDSSAARGELSVVSLLSHGDLEAAGQLLADQRREAAVPEMAALVGHVVEAGTDLAHVEARVAADRRVLDAADAWRTWSPHATYVLAPENALVAAVDARRALTGGTDGAASPVCSHPVAYPHGCDPLPVHAEAQSTADDMTVLPDDHPPCPNRNGFGRPCIFPKHGDEQVCRFPARGGAA